MAVLVGDGAWGSYEQGRAKQSLQLARTFRLHAWLLLKVCCRACAPVAGVGLGPDQGAELLPAVLGGAGPRLPLAGGAVCWRLDSALAL